MLKQGQDCEKKDKKKSQTIASSGGPFGALGVGIRGMFWMFPAMNTFFYNLTVFSAATLMPQAARKW